MNTPSFASASLYVGDLNPDINETQLFEIFKQVGPVASIRVCRDAITRRSLGYAYVNYHALPDAERALDLLNFTDIKGRPCRVMWSQRDPSLRKTGSGNIFIKNLDKSIDHKVLYDTFASFGPILSCKVSVDEYGNSKGFGFVHYETGEAAEEAIKKTNGKLVAGKKIFVGLFLAKKERQAQEDASPKWTNIFVKNIAKSVDDVKFKELFSKFGNVNSAVLMKEEAGSSKGFGFVNYDSHEEAKAAVDEMNGKDIDGLQLYVGKAQKKGEREKELKEMFEKLKRERMSKYQGVNLYVKNLDEAIDDAALRQEFSQSGTITSAKVMRDEKGASKGFGFVCFSTPDEATKAVTEMNGKMIQNKPIYVALAQRKEMRRMQLEARHAIRANGIRMQQQAQATGMTGSPLYAPGAPVFYAAQPVRGVYQPGAPRPGFAPYGPGAQGPRPGYQGMPYRGSGQRGGQRGGRGGRGGNRNAQQMPGSGPYPGIKYNPNVRNAQQAAVPNPEEQVQAPAAQLDAQRKQQLGETLYPLVAEALVAMNEQEEKAGKITGMVLELDPTELVHMIENPTLLNAKINEALVVLASAEKKE
jgi:polyadenylate-binding protein